MTKDIRDLIAEAKWILKMQHGLLTPHMREIFGPLVDALEASIGERDAATERGRQADAELRDMLRVDIPSLKAERDAVVTAIERVREIVSDLCSEGCCDLCEGKNEGWEMVLQALDGAPEPEEGVIKSPRWPDGCPMTINELPSGSKAPGHIDCQKEA